LKVGENMTPLKAIREKCIDCMCGSKHEVTQCPVDDCSLHQCRFGRNSQAKKREYTPEQRQAMIERLERARTAKTL